MEKEKKLIRIAAILLLIGCFIYLFLFGLTIIHIDSYDVFDYFVSIVLLVILVSKGAMGGLLLTYIKDEEVLKKKKGFVLAFAIISIFQNLIVAILLFIAHDNIGYYIRKENQLNQTKTSKQPKQIDQKTKTKQIVEKPKEVISPELKKIDILAKFGIGLVVLSGIILSTSENNLFASDISKPIMMTLLFGLFRVLYHLFDKKVVIKSSSLLYYYLSHIFFVLIFVSIGYFDIFGSELSFTGIYSKLMFAIVLISISYSVATTNYRYPHKFLGEISFATIICALILTMSQFDLETNHILGIILILSLFLYMNREKLSSAIINTNDFMFVAAGLLSLSKYFFNSDLVVFDLLLAIFVVVLLRLRTVSNDRFACPYRYFIPIFINLIIITTILHASTDCTIGTSSELFITPTVFNYRLISIISLLISGGLFIRGKDKETVYSGIYSSVILSTLEILPMLNQEYSMIAVLASIILFSYVTVILKMAQKQPIRLLLFISQFISLLFFSISGVLFYMVNGINTTYDTIMFVFIIFTIILNLFEKNIYQEYNIQKFMNTATIIGLLFTNIFFITQHSIVYNAIVIALIFAYRKYFNIEEKYSYVFNYLFILCGYLNLYNALMIYTSNMISNLILLVGLLVLSYYVNKDKKLSYLTLVLAYIPFGFLLGEFEIDLLPIIYRLPLIVLTFVISKKLLDLNDKPANVLECILLGLIFVTYIFTVDLTLGLCTFVLALIMIYIGFRFEKYNSLFIMGIGVTVVNIIVQLSDFWANVPLPVYLLVSGLAIIGYVTYKEINKNKVKDVKKEVKVIETRVVDTTSNIFMIILLLATVFSIVFINNINDYQEEVKKENETLMNLSNKGMDINKIRIYNDDKLITVLEGNHYDLKGIIKEYNGKEDYLSYDVCYYDEKDFNSLKNNKKKRKYSYGYSYDGSSRCFYTNGDIEDKFNFEKVTIRVENDIINYLDYMNDYSYNDGDYYYKDNYSKHAKLIYNIYDVDELELNIENVEGYVVRIKTTNGKEEEITEDGTYKFKSSDGVLKIHVRKLSLNDSTNEQDDINNYNDNYYSNGNNYYKQY